MAPEATCTLDRPATFRELRRPPHQLAIARQRRLDADRGHRRVRRRLDRRGGMRALVRVKPDDHACSVQFRYSKSHGRHADFETPMNETSPLLSQTAAGRRPEGKPWESQPEGGRRFTSQPDRRPTGRYEPQPVPTGTSHTSRRFRNDLDTARSARRWTDTAISFRPSTRSYRRVSTRLFVRRGLFAAYGLERLMGQRPLRAQRKL